MPTRFKFSLLVIVGLFSVFSRTQAGYLNIEPVIIDEKAKSGETLQETVTLLNRVNYKMNIYAVVNNLDARIGEQKFTGPAQADLSASLANWIELNRGVIQLLPGEKRGINFLIKVGSRAKAGIYHAGVAFYEGSDRIEAEKRRAGTSVIINLEITERSDDVVWLKKFSADKALFPGFPASFTYKLENGGDQPVGLSGEIRIFNRRNEEIGSVAIDEKEYAQPGKTLIASRDWQEMEGSRGLASLYEFGKYLGRYKAVLYLRPGNNQALIQETIFFWVVPWPLLVIVFSLLISIIGAMVYLLRRFYEENKT